MRAYWWKKFPNWGDRLTPLLLERFGITAEWAPPAEAEVVVVGSVVEHIPPGWSGTVLGAGKLHEGTRVRVSEAQVLALRGHLTARSLGVTDCAIGDPGLLAPMLIGEAGPKTLGTAVLPHWSESGETKMTIDPTWPPLRVIEAIASSPALVTSSLHGAIVADAFGVQRLVRLPASAAREGRGFKFRDYASALGQDIVLGEWQLAPRERVLAMQEDLRKAFESFAATVDPGAVP